MAQGMKIPLVDLKLQYQAIRQEVDAAIQAVIDKTAFIGGPFVKKFEQDFAGYVGRAHCVAVGNGTDALVMALRGLGLRPGDEVIVPALTFIATSEAVTLAGGKVVFVDVEPQSRCLDPQKVAEAINPATKGIIAVHLYGRPAPMAELNQLARQHGLWLVEDAAQAHGATYQGRKIGSLGTVGCFSFYPGKNLGAYGDGGAVVCDDQELALRIRMLANHGRTEKYDHLMEGSNSRMDGLQAAILSAKLPHLDQWNQARRKAAAEYVARLGAEPLVLPQDVEGHVYHLFVVECERRDQLLRHLQEAGIGASIHYPNALPLLSAYRYLNPQPGSWPVAERLVGQIVSLPLFPEINPAQLDYVGQTVHSFFQK